MSTYQATQEALAVRGLLESMRDDGADDDDLILAIQSESNAEEALRAAVVEVARLEAMAEACKATARRIKERGERHEAQVGRIKGGILATLEILGIRKMVLPEATVSAGRGRASVVITDEQLVPMAYRKADPRVSGAFYHLLRASSYAAANGHHEMAADFKGTAEALLPLFLLDRKKIEDALKAGQQVPGAALGNGAPYLLLRAA